MKFNEVTWYSKLAASVFFIGVLPSMTFVLGARYQEANDIVESAAMLSAAEATPPRSSGKISYVTKEINGFAVPQVVGYRDAAVMDRVNTRLSDMAYEAGCDPEFLAQPDAPETYYDASFSVSYAENDVLSVYLRASWYCGGPYPTNGANHSVTFDMQTGEEVAFADLFDRYVRNRSAIAATIFAEQIQKYDGPEDGQSCNGMYSLRFENDQPTLFSFADDLAYRIEGGDVVAEPIFPHVIAACAEEGRAPAKSLAKFFGPSSLLSRVR
jgi:hypothetical protein